MAQWVKVCAVAEAPQPGQVVEAVAGEFTLCLANVGGELSALDNWCPHRRGPLGQGWIEGNAVICPWHSWAFNVRNGQADYPENEKVDVFPLRIEGDSVLVDIS